MVECRLCVNVWWWIVSRSLCVTSSVREIGGRRAWVEEGQEEEWEKEKKERMGGKDYPRVFAELNWGKKERETIDFLQY